LTRIDVAGNIYAEKLLTKLNLIYPPDARASGIQGVVQLDVVVGRDGRVKEFKPLVGIPLLVPAAIEAVKGSIYSPTRLDGVPIEVHATVDVVFALP